MRVSFNTKSRLLIHRDALTELMKSWTYRQLDYYAKQGAFGEDFMHLGNGSQRPWAKVKPERVALCDIVAMVSNPSRQSFVDRVDELERTGKLWLTPNACVVVTKS